MIAMVVLKVYIRIVRRSPYSYCLYLVHRKRNLLWLKPLELQTAILFEFIMSLVNGVQLSGTVKC